MMSKKKFINIEIDWTLKNKLRHIAEEEERSLMGQIKYILKKHVKQFEKIDGEIVMPDQEGTDEE